MNDYRILLAISHNPHIKPERQKDLWNLLNKPSPEYLEEENLDKDAFEVFKSRMQSTGKILVK